MKKLLTVLAIATLLPGYISTSHAVDVNDKFCLSVYGHCLKKVSDGVYKTTIIPEQNKTGLNDRYFLIEEVDMRGVITEGSQNSKSTSINTENILKKSLWERQHEAYERLRERGELLTPKDPPSPKNEK